MKDGKTKRPGLLSSFIRHLQPQPGTGGPRAKATGRPGRGRDAGRGGARDDDGHGRDVEEEEHKGRLRDEDQRNEEDRDEAEDDRGAASRDEETDDAGDSADARDEDGETAPDRSYPRARTPRGRTAHDNGGRDEDGDSHDDDRRASRSGLSGAQAVQAAKEYLVQLTGREPEAVSGLERSGGGWSVTLEVVEMERVPETTDVMGSFRVQLDQGGELNGCTRVRRYYRNQPVEG